MKSELATAALSSFQEVVSHCKKLTKKNKEQLSEMMSLDKQKGLKALSKEKRQKLEAYQHLFYLLQVRLAALRRAQHDGRTPVPHFWGLSGFSPSLPADPARVPGQADLPDAPEQVDQVHGVGDLHALQLRLQPPRGLPAAPALQGGAAGGDQVGGRGGGGCPNLGTNSEKAWRRQQGRGASLRLLAPCLLPVLEDN